MSNDTPAPAPAPSLRQLLDTMSGAPDLSGFDKPAAPAPDALAALDWNRLMQGERRALDPEHQPIFDRLNAPAPAVEEIMRLADIWRCSDNYGPTEEAALRAAVEQIVRERDEEVEHRRFLLKTCSELEERAERAEREAAEKQAEIDGLRASIARLLDIIERRWQ